MRHQLSRIACSEMRANVERTQQHLAYLFTVEDYAQVISEAQRCRAVLQLCAEFAESPADQEINACAPQIILIQTRAEVAHALATRGPVEALYYVNRGLADMLDHFTHHASVQAYDRAREVRALERVRRRLLDQVFPGPRAELRTALAHAVREERYEDAARLRDRLRRPNSAGGSSN